MQIQAYQFIKYNSDTTLEHIEKVFNTGAVICIDFEDGIINPLNMEMTASLKEEARREFAGLYTSIFCHNENIQLGIRLNNVKSTEFLKDLTTIEGKKFYSIFIPKIEQPEDISQIKDKLTEYNVQYKFLIPVIESKTSLNNLENILQSDQLQNIIAFGHCDYNLDIDAFPFFHQDSWEYWKWIAAIDLKCKKYGTRIINSPYLDLGNENFFCSMLDYLETYRINFCGQFTLSTRQSELCMHRKPTDSKFTDFLENRNLISPEKEYAAELIGKFESNNKKKGLSKCNHTLISLQEYLASRKVMNENKRAIEVCFVGGCFPVQYDIVYENLFHQKLRRLIKEYYKEPVNINIIRYERLSNTLEKVKSLTDHKKLNLIIFHVRPEPFLRLTKLLFKYIDTKGRKKWSFNLPYFNLLNPERHDNLELQRLFPNHGTHNRSVFKKLLVSCNYICGYLAGNKQYALKSYYTKTKKIIDFCTANNTICIILGPNKRTNNYLEPILCKQLHLYISDKTDKQYYISGFENDSTKKMNRENGIHATQAYHDLIAEKLFLSIKNAM